MGAISATESLPVLRRYLDDPERAVRETCQIAVDKIEWDHSPEGQEHAKSVARQEAQYVPSIIFFLLPFIPFLKKMPHRAYTSVDPAPPTSSLLRGPASAVPTTQSVSELKAQLLDTSLPLFVRYRAMFALRNIGSDEAVDALSSGFDDDSALFKCVLFFRPQPAGVFTHC
jgi:deoxyhypusine monooxygenase